MTFGLMVLWGGRCCSTGHQTLLQIVTLCPSRTVQGIEAIFFMAPQPLVGQGPLHCRGFVITLRRTILSRTPLDEWSARRRGLYLTTHNTHNRQTSMPTARFEPAIPASERTQTHALDRAATGTGNAGEYKLPYLFRFRVVSGLTNGAQFRVCRPSASKNIQTKCCHRVSSYCV